MLIVSAIFLMQVAAGKTRLNKVGFFGLAVFLASALLMLGFGSYQSWLQYDAWKNDEFGKFLLPPYQSSEYYFFHIRTRIFNPYFLSFSLAVFFLLIAKFFNKKYNYLFFEKGEAYLFAAAIFLAGSPGWFFYLIFVLLAGVAASAVQTLINGPSYRLSLYYLWLPTALFTILISRWLAEYSWWQLLKV